MSFPIIKQFLREFRELYYLIAGKPHGLGYIIMLHHIREPNLSGLPQCEILKVSVQHLERFIIEAKKKFDIIRIEEVPYRLKEKHKKKFLVFTFDDGYKEVLTVALPIFQKHTIPFTLFLSTSFPEKDAILWNEILESLILSHNSLTLSNGYYYSLKTRREKIFAYNQICSMIMRLNKNNFSEELARLFNDYDIDWYADNDKYCLNWNDIIKLLSYPLFTIGSHTHSHFKLDILQTKKNIEDEIMKAVELIKENTGFDSKVFAYPYGGASHREFSVLASLHNSISLSVLASGGPVTSRTNKLEQLPRVIFDNSVSVRDLLHNRNVYMGI